MVLVDRVWLGGLDGGVCLQLVRVDLRRWVVRRWDWELLLVSSMYLINSYVGSSLYVVAHSGTKFIVLLYNTVHGVGGMAAGIPPPGMGMPPPPPPGAMGRGMPPPGMGRGGY